MNLTDFLTVYRSSIGREKRFRGSEYWAGGGGGQEEVEETEAHIRVLEKACSSLAPGNMHSIWPCHTLRYNLDRNQQAREASTGGRTALNPQQDLWALMAFLLPKRAHTATWAALPEISQALSPLSWIWYLCTSQHGCTKAKQELYRPEESATLQSISNSALVSFKEQIQSSQEDFLQGTTYRAYLTLDSLWIGQFSI